MKQDWSKFAPVDDLFKAYVKEGQQLVAKGDKKAGEYKLQMALETLTRGYQHVVYGSCRRWLSKNGIKDGEVVKEVAQDVFLGAWQSILRFDTESTVRFWLFGIAKHKRVNTLDAIVKDRNRFTYTDEILEPRYGAPAVEEEIEQEEWLKHIREKLKPADLEILNMSFKGHSTTEISAAVKMAEGNVRVRLHRIREQLRSFLN